MITATPAPHVAPISIPATVAVVPFYSQFKDIESAAWQKVGCGIASLAMVIDYYKPSEVTANTLLKEGIKKGAYDQNAGWKHAGLISLAASHGLTGTSYDLTGKSSATAFKTLSAHIATGPVIVSVHYKFDPKNPIPHLVVIDGMKDGVIYYNDPAAKDGQKQISSADFIKAWKQKYIVIRPSTASA